MPTAPTLSRREAELMDALRHLGGSGRNAELARVLDVSEETVRRTIKTLAKAGLIGRVHGGAHLTGAQAGASFFAASVKTRRKSSASPRPRLRRSVMA